MKHLIYLQFCDFLQLFFKETVSAFGNYLMTGSCQEFIHGRIGLGTDAFVLMQERLITYFIFSGFQTFKCLHFLKRYTHKWEKH